MNARVRRAAVAVIIGCGFVMSCEAPSAGGPESVQLELAWTPPVGSVATGVWLAEPPRVRVTSGEGRPLAATRVAFTVVRGGGLLNVHSVDTDVDGYASTGWRTGNTVGTQEVRAYVPRANDGEYVAFVISVSAAPPAPANVLMPIADVP